MYGYLHKNTYIVSLFLIPKYNTNIKNNFSYQMHYLSAATIPSWFLQNRPDENKLCSDYHVFSNVIDGSCQIEWHGFLPTSTHFVNDMSLQNWECNVVYKFKMAFTRLSQFTLPNLL